MKIDRHKLRKIREEKGYSLRELAELSGIDYTSLYRWETLDTAQPRPGNVSKVAKALDIAVNQLEKNEKETDSNKEFSPIIFWLDYWIAYSENAPTCPYNGNEVVYDIYRALNDFDCKQAKGNLLADTIFSVWNPLKMVLEYLNPGEKFYKENKYGSDKNYYLKKIKNNIDAYLPRGDSLVKELLIFARYAMTRANVMILPSRAMQGRGIKYLDQMPASLYQCFDNGEYHKYFKEIEIEKWIHQEHLEMFFKNGEIEKNNILPLIKRMKASEHEWLSKKDELEEMLHRYNEILEKRLDYFCCF